jgi:hypothetical protein
MPRSRTSCGAILVAAGFVFCINRVASAGELLAVRFEDGALYRASTVDGSLTPTIPTAQSFVGALEMSPADGFVYGFTAEQILFRFHPTTFELEVLGKLDQFLVEGGLAFAPDGTAYAATGGSAKTPQLYRLNVNTLAMTLVGTISGGAHDINGLAWRADGTLVGTDRESNSLITIDPTTAASSALAPLTPLVGAVGGMAVLDGVGYLATGTPGSTTPGSNELWRFDLFTGQHARVGSFAPTIGFPSVGISGLAAIPEPSLSAFVIGVHLAARRRRRGL